MTQLVSPFPTKSELTRPLLELMSNDQTWSRAELKDSVADAFRLPPKLRDETVKSGGTRLETRVSWALHNRVNEIGDPTRGRATDART